MTAPESTPQNTELDPESPTDEATTNEATTDEATTDVNEAGEEEATSDYQEAGEEGVAANYQTRMDEFDEVEASVPVTTLPTESRDLDQSDLEVNP